MNSPPPQQAKEQETLRLMVRLIYSCFEFFSFYSNSSCYSLFTLFLLKELTGLWIMIGIGFVFALIIWALKKSFEVKLNYQSPFIDYLNENTPIFE